MVQRCDLCGARLRAEDDACRECGTPHAAAGSSEGVAAPAPDKAAGSPKSPSRVGAIPLPVAEDVTRLTDVSAPGPTPLTAIAPAETSASPPVPPPGVEDSPAQQAPIPAPLPEQQSPAVAVPPPGGMTSAPMPEIPSAPLDVDGATGRKSPVLWVGAALIGVGVIAAVVALSGGSEPSDDAPSQAPQQAKADAADKTPAVGPAVEPAGDDCEALPALAGKWSIASEVTGAGAARKLDIRGYYELEIAVADCVATATLSKTGFKDKTFAERHVQHGTATLERGTGAFAFGYGSGFSLRDSRDKGVDQEFFFSLQDGKLRGVWRQTGKIWNRTGLSGVLVGAREADARALVPQVSALSCGGRCVFACDGLASEVASEDLGTCVTACDAAPTQAAVCGSRLPATPELQLALTGPAPTLDALCSGFSCDVDPKLERRRTPSIKGNAGAVHSAHFVHASGGDGGSMRLALQTDGGWFLSAALSPTGGANLGKEISSVNIAATALGSGGPAAVVTGHFARQGKALMFACRGAGEAPVCVVARGLEQARNVAVLPEGALTVRAPGPGALYAW